MKERPPIATLNKKEIRLGSNKFSPKKKTIKKKVKCSK